MVYDVHVFWAKTWLDNICFTNYSLRKCPIITSTKITTRQCLWNEIYYQDSQTHDYTVDLKGQMLTRQFNMICRRTILVL